MWKPTILRLALHQTCCSSPTAVLTSTPVWVKEGEESVSGMPL